MYKEKKKEEEISTFFFLLFRGKGIVGVVVVGKIPSRIYKFSHFIV